MTVTPEPHKRNVTNGNPSYQGQRVSKEQLHKRILKLRTEGLSYDKIAIQLRSEGYRISKNTVRYVCYEASGGSPDPKHKSTKKQRSKKSVDKDWKDKKKPLNVDTTIKLEGHDPGKCPEELLNEIIAKQKKEGIFDIDKPPIKITTTHPVGLCAISDLHLGSSGVNYEYLKEVVELINDTPNLFVAIGGDLIDNFIIQKLNIATEQREFKVEMQYKFVAYILDMLAGRVLWMIRGNHEAWTERYAFVDQMAKFATWKNLPYYKDGGIVKLDINGIRYKVHHRHKFWGMSKLNRHNAGKRMYDFGQEPYDIGILEHFHEGSIESFHRHDEKRISINSATFKEKDPYAESLGYYHTGIEIPVAIMYPNQKKLAVIDDMDTAALTLRAMAEMEWN